MHSGLHLPNGEPDRAINEVRQIVQELSRLQFEGVEPAKVAVVYDYEAAWTLQIQPQGNEFDYMEIVLRFYRSLRRLGLNVDVISQKSPLEPYNLVVIPSLPILRPEFVASLKQFRGQVLVAPRTGSKTAHRNCRLAVCSN
jgi:beta-galactosidase